MLTEDQITNSKRDVLLSFFKDIKVPVGTYKNNEALKQFYRDTIKKYECLKRIEEAKRKSNTRISECNDNYSNSQ